MRIAGRWQITEAELWDSDALNLVAPAFIEFAEDGSGSFGFIAVQGRWHPIPRSSPHRPFPLPTSCTTARSGKRFPATGGVHGRPQGLTQRPGTATRWPAQVPASP